MEENQALGNVITYLQDVILEKVTNAYEMFMEENSIPQKSADHKDVINQVTDEQTDLGYNDFIKSKDLSQENINDQVREYVNANYDSEFFIVKVAEKIDYDEIRESLVEDLLLNLINTEPYNVVPREYWNNQARRVPNIKELAEYTKTDGLEPFVERYAPEWEEIAKEN